MPDRERMMGMPAYALVNFLIYCLVNSFTPGPGNILALNTVTNYGWKKGKPLFFGIFAGYYAVQFLCALVVYGVNAMLPGVMGVIKYVGAAYILWLAVHIALSRPDLDQGEQSASFWKGYIVPYTSALPALLFFEGMIATIGTVATGTWIAAGMLIQRFYRAHYRPVNILLALTLLECVYGILK